ncbi:MAG TPA: hypothetical protein VJB60_02950 [Candidatus Peribacterales bacterium]|nr:hypothetical protein [Candidatus Peribacterales bacterium]
MLLPLISLGSIILLLEGGMWLLFRRGAVRICIPADVYVLRKPRVTMAMLGGFALIHAACLFLILATTYFFLW